MYQLYALSILESRIFRASWTGLGVVNASLVPVFLRAGAVLAYIGQLDSRHLGTTLDMLGIRQGTGR